MSAELDQKKTMPCLFCGRMTTHPFNLKRRSKFSVMIVACGSPGKHIGLIHKRCWENPEFSGKVKKCLKLGEVAQKRYLWLDLSTASENEGEQLLETLKKIKTHKQTSGNLPA